MSLINKEILPFTAQAYDPKMMSLKKFHKKILKVHGASYASILLTLFRMSYRIRRFTKSIRKITRVRC